MRMKASAGMTPIAAQTIISLRGRPSLAASRPPAPSMMSASRNERNGAGPPRVRPMVRRIMAERNSQRSASMSAWNNITTLPHNKMTQESLPTVLPHHQDSVEYSASQQHPQEALAKRGEQLHPLSRCLNRERSPIPRRTSAATPAADTARQAR